MDIRELIRPAELVGVVRSPQLPGIEKFTLANVFPRRNVNEIDYGFMRGAKRTVQVAPYRSFDAEAPIGARPGLTRVVGQLMPISYKQPLTETQRLMRNALERQGGPLGGAATQAIVDQIFDDAGSLRLSVEARLELARGDALTDGIITINENGLQFTIDFGMLPAHKPVAATLWSNAAADILGDLTSWMDTYSDTNNGDTPGRFLTSKRVLRFMLANNSIRQLAGNLIGQPLAVTREQLNQILGARDLPQVEVYDLKVQDVSGAVVRPIPDNRVVLLPDAGVPIGQTQYGETVEAMELANQGLLPPTDVPGPVAIVWKAVDPVTIWTLAAAISVPLVVNPDLVLTATVL